ncbi:diphthamide biosynthesis protein 4-like isoform X2 [Salvia splendens]|uniref:diphthamide biosynthesis protein 4-like isoform X2 n=1 Tax=Salvia splendens TaxID=180675 RepID=UPI001C26E9B6|nr:diphthamide biosynthesis protein 4-like isoform X2 [Salvia splendens]
MVGGLVLKLGRTHYETIGVKEDASQEEIRKTYRSAVIAIHPDKLGDSLGNEFIELQRAWRVLCDPGLRALYDQELRTLRQEAVAAEDVRLGDMAVVEDEEEDEDEDGGSFELSYQCRCGDFFSIMSCELDEMGYRIQRIGGKLISEAEDAACDFDEEDEVFVSAVMTKYMESKCKRRSSSGAATRLCRCLSATSYNAFFSVKKRFSRSSSWNETGYRDLSKQSAVILELLQDEGWPFGLSK